MDNQPPAPGKPTLASIQAKIDAPQFEKSSVHIIERFLEHFASDGTMTFDVPKHILEALAARFRPFLEHEVATLDKAFGGQTGRQRQAIDTATQVDTITFMVIEELKRCQRRTATRGLLTAWLARMSLSSKACPLTTFSDFISCRSLSPNPVQGSLSANRLPCQPIQSSPDRPRRQQTPRFRHATECNYP